MKRPTERELKDEARERFAEALDRYEAVNGALKRRPIRPGYIIDRGRWRLRGEYVDVPRRFLDLTPARRAEGMGDVNDKAAELGFEDGDALREYLADVRRPILADYVRMEYVNATMPQAERNKTMRERRLERGLCSRCGRVAPRPEKTTCQSCNDRAAQAVAASREAKRNAPAPDAAIPEPGRLERELQEILG